MLDKKYQQAAEKVQRQSTVTGSGRPKCRTKENVNLFNDLVLSQENTPHTQRTVREISRETNIRLRCYEITTSLVAAFYWNAIIICTKMQRI